MHQGLNTWVAKTNECRIVGEEFESREAAIAELKRQFQYNPIAISYIFFDIKILYFVVCVCVFLLCFVLVLLVYVAFIFLCMNLKKKHKQKKINITNIISDRTWKYC